jgi:hypothetical protein
VEELQKQLEESLTLKTREEGEEILEAEPDYSEA